MQTDEYLKLAEVEDQMWYFRSLHAHVGRELSAVLTRGSRAHLASSGKTTRPSLAGQETGVRHMAAGEQGSRSTPAVLDAGCGTGGLILRLRKQHPEWSFAGIDFMPLAC